MFGPSTIHTLHRLSPRVAAAALLAIPVGPSLPAFAQPSPAVTVNLSAQNNSGLSGTATLTDLGSGKTHVELSVSGPEGDYPAHIHMGTCANLTPAPQYPLTNVRGGSGLTDVDASLVAIQQSPHAINLHKSAQDLATYVACGDVAAAGAARATPSVASPPSAPATPSVMGQPGVPFTAARARDGQSLATQAPATQALFLAVWRDRAAQRWVDEHEAELGRATGSPPASPATLVPSPAPRAAFAVAMTPADRFDPASLTIPRGATVTWTNKDTDPHTATGDPAKSIPGLRAIVPSGAAPWDAGVVAPGQSWSHTFDTPGYYVYFCQFHGPMGMVGTIDVTG